ncbi:MAG: hypothetical protein H0T62_08390 [Parachlamydiaceae bacterium]|nr:hypothetical protein [Parachlamydiaceae bacterium]
MGFDPVNNSMSQKISNNPIDAGSSMHLDNSVELTKSASKLVMNSHLPIGDKNMGDLKITKNETSKLPVAGGKIAVATSIALNGGLNAVSNLHLVKQLSNGIGDTKARM